MDSISIPNLTCLAQINPGSQDDKQTLLTFLFKTPHLEKSVIFKLYFNPAGSEVSGRI